MFLEPNKKKSRGYSPDQYTCRVASSVWPCCNLFKMWTRAAISINFIETRTAIISDTQNRNRTACNDMHSLTKRATKRDCHTGVPRYIGTQVCLGLLRRWLGRLVLGPTAVPQQEGNAQRWKGHHSEGRPVQLQNTNENAMERLIHLDRLNERKLDNLQKKHVICIAYAGQS